LLPGGLSNSEARCIVISGSDIYISGYISNSPGVTAACYWKNDSNIVLDTDYAGSNAEGLAVAGSDVFAVGFKGITATRWKNGAASSVTNSPDSFVTSVIINDADVLEAGVSNAANNQSVATYWKNGVQTQLTDGSTYSDALGITASGSDVYICGDNLGGKATYWKNGNPVQLSTSISSAYSIAVVSH